MPPRNLKRRHKWLIGLTVGWFVVVVAAHTQLFYLFGPDWMNEEFAESFWPSFISDFGVGLLLAWFLGEALHLASRYDLQMNHTFSDEINHRKTIYLYLVNCGEETFKPLEIEWHIFVERNVVSRGSISKDASRLEEIKLSGKLYRHYHDLIAGPLYSGQRTRLMEITVIRPGETSSSRLYFYFATAPGLFPQDVKIESDGQPLLSNLDAAKAFFDVTLPPNVSQ